VIEAGSRIVICSAHVPFTDKCGGVSGALQVLRKEDRVFGDQAIVVDHAMLVSVQPRQDRRTTRRTKRCCDKRVLQVNAVTGQRIEMRCFQERMPGKPHRVKSMIVSQKENDVSRLDAVAFSYLRKIRRKHGEWGGETEEKRKSTHDKRSHDSGSAVLGTVYKGSNVMLAMITRSS
jgi:hypothetical protein